MRPHPPYVTPDNPACPECMDIRGGCPECRPQAYGVRNKTAAEYARLSPEQRARWPLMLDVSYRGGPVYRMYFQTERAREDFRTALAPFARCNEPGPDARD